MTTGDPSVFGPPRFRRGLGHLFARDERGVTAIEFGFLALPFFMLVFVLLQSALIYAGQMTMTFETQKIARQIRTGQLTDPTVAEAKLRSNLCAALLHLIDCAGLAIDLKSYATYADIPTGPPMSNGSLNRAGFTFQNPGSSRLVALRVYYELPLIGLTEQALSNLSGGKYLLSAVHIFRTEPF